MQTVVGIADAIVLEEKPVPSPGAGQVLIRSRACGICGSDLHMVRHFDETFGPAGPNGSDEQRGVLLGHELAGEVAAHGPGAGTIPVGTRVASIPFVTEESGASLSVGVNGSIPGGFSEYYLLDESSLIVIPDDVPDETVALGEPLAVGLHAVARGDVGPADIALVIGCGAVGLATIVALRMRGVETIIATDPVEQRRNMAADMGATHTIDPLADDEMALLGQLATDGHAVIMECAGVTPLIPSIMNRAPAKSRIVIVGVHTTDVTITPRIAMRNELDLRFTFYYSAEEYAEAIDAIVSRRFDLSQLVTATVGIDGIGEAFDVLNGPNEHLKIIVQPWRAGGLTPVGEASSA